jgi:predicted MFS family arabinose efflux permease
VDWAGYDAAFLFLAACAAVALVVLWRTVPETPGWTKRAADSQAVTAAEHGFG